MQNLATWTHFRDIIMQLSAEPATLDVWRNVPGFRHVTPQQCNSGSVSFRRQDHPAEISLPRNWSLFQDIIPLLVTPVVAAVSQNYCIECRSFGVRFARCLLQHGNDFFQAGSTLPMYRHVIYGVASLPCRMGIFIGPHIMLDGALDVGFLCASNPVHSQLGISNS